MSKGEFVDYTYTKENDTLRLHRRHGDWWFGFFGGASTNINFGKFKIEEDPFEEESELIDFPGGMGVGLSLGLSGDWLPPGEEWGASLKISFLDYRYNSFSTQPIPGDDLERYFESTVTYNYITISPSVRYSFPFAGFHLFGGLDFEILTNSKIKFYKRRVDRVHSNIEDEYVELPYNINTFRLGLHIGAGFDLFSADWNHVMRLYLSPFFALHASTNYFSEFGSSRTNVTAQVGLAFRFGPDDILIDTLKFNPNYIAPPYYLAYAEYERGVSFPGFNPYVAESISDIAYIPPQIVEEIAEEPSIRVDESAAIQTIEPIAEIQPTQETKPVQEEPLQQPIVKIDKNYKKILQFSTPESAQISKKDREELDVVVSYMKSNPQSRLWIIGHSDNTGTTDQNTQRAQARADAVMQYLIKKGVPKGRLLVRSRGSVAPIADNRTEAGRRKNRRVELEFVK